MAVKLPWKRRRRPLRSLLKAARISKKEMSRTLIATMLPRRWWERSADRNVGPDRAAAAVAVVVGAAAAAEDVDAGTMGAVVDTVGMVVTAGMAAGGRIGPR